MNQLKRDTDIDYAPDSDYDPDSDTDPDEAG